MKNNPLTDSLAIMKIIYNEKDLDTGIWWYENMVTDKKKKALSSICRSGRFPPGSLF